MPCPPATGFGRPRRVHHWIKPSPSRPGEGLKCSNCGRLMTWRELADDDAKRAAIEHSLCLRRPLEAPTFIRVITEAVRSLPPEDFQ